jgi:hypothetical protein
MVLQRPNQQAIFDTWKNSPCKAEFCSIVSPPMAKPITIRELIKLAPGGAPAIAEASQRTDHPIGVDAVYKWRLIGIPDHHWPLMLRLTGVSLDAIFNANQSLRRRRRRQSRQPSDNTPSGGAQQAVA